MIDHINENGLLLLGCGKMGSSMLQGWLKVGVKPTSISIIEPYPSDWLKSLETEGLTLNPKKLGQAAICIFAVKPQMMGEALTQLQQFNSLFLSIAAGTKIKQLENSLGFNAKIIRAMPNTPAAIGKGISAIIGNQYCKTKDIEMVEMLLGAVGTTIRLEHEDQMDAVTAISGSGPAYIFHFIEAFIAASVDAGLPLPMAKQLVVETTLGAASLAQISNQDVAQLRIKVTSPGGTTQAALEILMAEDNGLQALLGEAVKAAVERSKALGNG